MCVWHPHIQTGIFAGGPVHTRITVEALKYLLYSQFWWDNIKQNLQPEAEAVVTQECCRCEQKEINSVNSRAGCNVHSNRNILKCWYPVKYLHTFSPSINYDILPVVLSYCSPLRQECVTVLLLEKLHIWNHILLKTCSPCLISPYYGSVSSSFLKRREVTKANQLSCLRHAVNSLKLRSVILSVILHVQTSVSGQVLNLNFCKILSRVIFVSNKPIFMPMQPRGPAPKGRYAKGCRSFLASSVNLEGAEMETSSRNAFCSWFHVFFI